MNKAAKMANILKFIEDNDVDFLDSSYIIHGMDDKRVRSVLFGIYGVLMTNQFILVFGEYDLTLILLTASGNFNEVFRKIPYKDIGVISVRNAIFYKILSFSTPDENFRIRCSKKVIGMGWQKDNLETCLNLPMFVE